MTDKDKDNHTNLKIILEDLTKKMYFHINFKPESTSTLEIIGSDIYVSK